MWPSLLAPKRSPNRVANPRSDRRPITRFRPRLEALEARWVPSKVPAGFTVTNTLDDGSKGSLRYEIAQAEMSRNFAAGLQGTITLTSGQLDITRNLTIQGPGASLLTISGGGFWRIFEVAPNVTAAISGLTITQGNSSISPDHLFSGGDIVNLGTLTLTNCTVSDGS